LALTALASSAAAQDRLGVVLMHGKQSAPEQHTPLADAITAAGFLVEPPEMCWSGRRIYDRSYLDCLRDIDAATERLRQRGARAIVVAGHSLGANAALAYGARHAVKGVIALAPGHAPELRVTHPRIAASLDRAHKLIAEQRGDERSTFSDFNGDLAISVTATAKTYLSFFAPNSPAVMPDNAARLTAPLLVVAGSADPFQRGPDYFRESAFPRAQSLRHGAVRPFRHFGGIDGNCRRVAADDRAALSRPELHEPALLHRGPDERGE
jgi:pimeloyl-ACP methyl ester carboxylesterase